MAEYFSYGGGSSGGSTYTPDKLGTTTGGGGGGSIDLDPEEDGFGKGSIDITDPLGSVADTAGSFAQFGGGLIGGVAGAIGSIGPDGETASIGQLFEDIGRIPGGVGDFQLPYLGDDPNRQAATLSQVPGAMFEPVYQAQQAIQRQVAGQRVESIRKDGAVPGGELPPDLQHRLEAGESVDAIVEELVARNAGYSSNPVVQFGAEVILDPLNLIAPVVGKGLTAAKMASSAIHVPKAYAAMNLPTRAAGIAYDTAARGLSAGGRAFVDRALGPTTTGAFQYLGAKPYQTFRNGFGKLSPDYAAQLDDAAGVANANLLNAVAVNDVAAGAAGRAFDDLDASIAASMTATRAYAPKELERRAEDLLRDTAPDFLGMSADDLTDFTARAMARITGASYEDALRVVGKADVKAAQTAHWLRYGKAIDEFGTARESAMLGDVKNIDVERLTLIGEDTLTVERAADLVKAAKGGGIYDEAMRYGVIRNHFTGKNPSDGDILAFIAKLKNEGALHEAVKTPKSGKNKLPGPLSEWQQKWRDDGYILGFAPKDGIKAIRDEDGNVLWSKPFVNVTTRRDPTAIANPLGRFMDATTRGITQGRIVHESRDRLLRIIVEQHKLPVSPNQVRSIHKTILEEAASRKLTPRGLSIIDESPGQGRPSEPVYNAIFRRFLSPAEYDALTTQFDPMYVVMKAFQGNWDTVGLTQKATGQGKVIPIVARIAEGLYPKARFTYRPTFQIQEMIESPVFNALRGVTRREVSPELREAYQELLKMPEFKYLEAVEYLNIAGNAQVTKFMGTNTRLGRAMGRFTNIQARKESRRVQQIFSEHGEEFRDAVNSIDPRAWHAMTEAYGTTDPRAIADAFLTERMRLASGDIDEAMAVIDESFDVAGHSIQQAYDAGDIARGQAENVAEGVRRGGTAESGGAMKPNAPKPPWAQSVEGEMVWQAFKDSFRQSSIQAFKTHFFNPRRGWLERTVNHPFLGIYPLSYMWGKVLPEFARFLLVRPFGVNAPLVGAVNLERVQQAYLGALADDPAFSAYMEEHEESIYFANLLFPGNPVNLTANAPRWMRHTSQDIAEGRKVTPQTVVREFADSSTYALAGGVRDVSQFANVLGDFGVISEDLFANLERAAREYDGMVAAGN